MRLKSSPASPPLVFLVRAALNVADPSYQNLLIIPALLQTAVLALLSAAVPMRATATSAVAAVSLSDGETQITMDPSPREADKSRSVHVLAFTSFSELLLAESEGDFTMPEWDQVYETSRGACCGAADSNGTHAVLDEANQNGPDMRRFIRSAAESKVAADLYWK
jgi:exosome complex component RRP46